MEPQTVTIQPGSALPISPEMLPTPPSPGIQPLIRVELFGEQIALGWLILAVGLLSLIATQLRGKKKGLPVWHPAHLIATGFGFGHLRPMPGTLGTLLGLWLFTHLVFLPKSGLISPPTMLGLLFLSTVGLTLIGLWASAIYAERTGKDDPSEVVIDEIAGLFLTFSLAAIIFAPLGIFFADQFKFHLILFPYFVIALFLLFRLFDMWKIGWVKRADRLKSGFGIMLDDLAAAFYAVLAFYVIFFTLHFTGAFEAYYAAYYPALVG